MIISWGKPTITATKLGGSGSAISIPTPVDGSTQLTSEKGDKMEALIEGGEPEAVKFKRGKYTLEFQVRLGYDTTSSSMREFPIDGTDGVVDGEWSVTLDPEDANAPGFTMPKAVCSYTDNFSSADGIIRTYTFDSLKPDSGNQIQWNA